LQGFWSDAQEADMRERLKFTSDGRVYAVTPDFVIDQILRGLPHADYTRITAPTLSIYSLEPLVHPRIPANASEADRKRAQDYWDEIRAANLAQIEQFKRELPAAHVIEMEDTDHYNFIQRRRFVAREIRSFLSER
jgi:pimeloyl-ACP methyl ester carboxylesterase